MVRKRFFLEKEAKTFYCCLAGAVLFFSGWAAIAACKQWRGVLGFLGPGCGLGTSFYF
jgi:hypothetical protein